MEMSYCAILLLAINMVCSNGVDTSDELPQRTLEISMPGSLCQDLHPDVQAAHIYGADHPFGGCVRLKAQDYSFLIVYQWASLRCEQRLKVFDGPMNTVDAFMDIPCNQELIFPVVRYSHRSDITIQFENPSKNRNFNFSLMITSSKADGLCADSSSYLCMYKDHKICISRALTCDGYINCPDGQDEDDGCTVQTLEGDVARRYHSVTTGIVAIVLTGAIITCIGCVATIVCCVRQYQTREREVFPQTLDSAIYPQNSETVPGSTGFYPSGPETSHSGGYQRLSQTGYDQSQTGYDQASHSGYDPPPQGQFEPLPASVPKAPKDTESLDNVTGVMEVQQGVSSTVTGAETSIKPDSQTVHYNTTSANVEMPLQVPTEDTFALNN